MDDTIYKEIPGHPGYLCGTDGSVWSVKSGQWKQLKELVLRPYNKYYAVGLYTGGKHCRYLVHRLVLLTFRGPCPAGMEACHANDVSTDNRLENLRWDTRDNNMKERVANPERGNHGTRHGLAKLTDEVVQEIRRRHVKVKPGQRHGNTKELAEEFGVGTQAIGKIVNGHRWQHVKD